MSTVTDKFDRVSPARRPGDDAGLGGNLPQYDEDHGHHIAMRGGDAPDHNA